MTDSADSDQKAPRVYSVCSRLTVKKKTKKNPLEKELWNSHKTVSATQDLFQLLKSLNQHEVWHIFSSDLKLMVPLNMN